MFAKFLLTVVAVVAVWLGFKYYARFVVGPGRRRAMPRPQPAVPNASQDQRPAGPVEDMTPCAVCGAYIPVRGAARCGRHDCPF